MCVESRIVGFDVELERLFRVGVVVGMVSSSSVGHSVSEFDIVSVLRSPLLHITLGPNPSNSL